MYERPTPEERLEREYSPQELIEQLIDQGRVVDQGQDGIILKINPEELDGGVLAGWQKLGVDFAGSTAMKLLKIYQKGSIQEEHRLQERAYAMLRSGNDQRAGTPRPMYYGEFTVTHGIAEKIPEILQNGQAELMLMEFVPGVDLERTIYHRAYEELFDDAPRIEDSLVDALRVPVCAELEIGQLDPETGKMAHLKRETAEAKKLFLFLKRHGHRLNPHIVEKLENALRTFQKAGFHHRDLHGRNIIIQGDAFAIDENVQVFIIDYGRATDASQEQDYGDKSIVHLLKTLSPDYEALETKRQEEQQKVREEIQEKKREHAQQLHGEVLLVRADPSWAAVRTKTWQEVVQVFKKANPNTESKIYGELLATVLKNIPPHVPSRACIMDIFGMLARHTPANPYSTTFSFRRFSDALAERGIPRHEITRYVEFYQ